MDPTHAGSKSMDDLDCNGGIDGSPKNRKIKSMRNMAAKRMDEASPPTKRRTTSRRKNVPKRKPSPRKKKKKVRKKKPDASSETSSELEQDDGEDLSSSGASTKTESDELQSNGTTHTNTQKTSKKKGKEKETESSSSEEEEIRTRPRASWTISRPQRSPQKTFFSARLGGSQGKRNSHSMLNQSTPAAFVDPMADIKWPARRLSGGKASSNNGYRHSNPIISTFDDLQERLRGVTPSSQSIGSPHVGEMMSEAASKDQLTIKFPVGVEMIKVVVHSQMTAAQIKLVILEQTAEEIPGCKLGEPDDYVLVVLGVNYFITNENLPLRRVQVIQVARKSFIKIPLMMLERETEYEEQENVKSKILAELQLNTKIYKLTTTPSNANPLRAILESNNEEVEVFRKHITRVRQKVLKERTQTLINDSKETVTYNTNYLPQYRESEPCPPNVPSTLIIHCYLPGSYEKVSIISIASDLTVKEVTEKIFDKYRKTDPVATANTTCEDYILKVTSFKEYLIGQHPILSYDYIRKTISKEGKITLSLLEISDIDLQIPEYAEASVSDMVLCRKKLKSEKRSREISITQNKLKLINFCNQHFRVKIQRVENVDNFNNLYEQWTQNDKDMKQLKKDTSREVKRGTCLYVRAQLCHGDVVIADDMFTNAMLYCNNPVWDEWLTTSLAMCNIPRGARLCFTLYRLQFDGNADVIDSSKLHVDETKDVPLGWVNCQFINHKDQLRQGICSFKLWPGKGNIIGTCVENVASQTVKPPILYIEFQTSEEVICFPPLKELTEQLSKEKESSEDIDRELTGLDHRTKKKIIKKIEKIKKIDALVALKEEEQQLLWEYRDYCSQFPSLLPRFIQYTKWNDSEAVKIAHSILYRWEPPSAFDCFQLLDAKYADPIVRKYAVDRMKDLSDRECADFLLQLTQVLKYESYHNSPLAQFLLTRALKNVNQIGHSLFWHLKSELHNPTIASRYSLLLEAYLRGCGPHGNQLLKQNDVLNQLAAVANRIKDPKIKNEVERKKILLQELRKVKFPERFLLPLNPRLEVTGLKIDKCKNMDSKKLPLWLVFKNVEKRGKDVYVIFKAGDDLRQDVLTLQMIRIMDKMWKAEGLDCRLNAYGCVATGDELGMIEIVLNSATTASINKDAGKGAKAVLYKDTLKKWLQKHNPSPTEWEKAVETFILSCAGYCVATYVLGIGDRHNDNIMVTESGHLFHIDFGHFLGNFKSKYGIKRERAPFIFNPQYAYVMGDKRDEPFQQFIQLCGRAYNIIRRHADMFINLFLMMLSTGIPELQCEEDIEPLRDNLQLDLTDEEVCVPSFPNSCFSCCHITNTIFRLLSTLQT